MSELSLKEAIRGLENIKSLIGLVPSMTIETSSSAIDILSLAISKLQLLEQVESGGVEKKLIVQDFETGSSGWSEQDCREFGQLEGFNSAIDLCNADLARRLRYISYYIQ